MFRSIMIGAVATAVLAVGAVSAFASNTHGKAVSHLAGATTLTGEAKGDAISALARSQGDAKSDAAKAEATTADRDAHGDAVSAIAKKDGDADDTALGNHGKHKKPNHGGAVSVVASANH
jgi:hypothetical protein